ncbi:hypothetical protein BLNAU_20041 [Blattamonas nauphoetae]|uniref:Uncharacterized protein n=1 Tax=Blattamonas nauphoetae TaxID=2049346 RepID=A0ABQ9X0D3_9EUKA|nr:hypothetical protein BLNAU_20041 [Blattamonas nauphoetae]
MESLSFVAGSLLNLPPSLFLNPRPVTCEDDLDNFLTPEVSSEIVPKPLEDAPPQVTSIELNQFVNAHTVQIRGIYVRILFILLPNTCIFNQTDEIHSRPLTRQSPTLLHFQQSTLNILDSIRDAFRALRIDIPTSFSTLHQQRKERKTNIPRPENFKNDDLLQGLTSSLSVVADNRPKISDDPSPPPPEIGDWLPLRTRKFQPPQIGQTIHLSTYIVPDELGPNTTLSAIVTDHFLILQCLFGTELFDKNTICVLGADLARTTPDLSKEVRTQKRRELAQIQHACEQCASYALQRMVGLSWLIHCKPSENERKWNRIDTVQVKSPKGWLDRFKDMLGFGSKSSPEQTLLELPQPESLPPPSSQLIDHVENEGILSEKSFEQMDSKRRQHTSSFPVTDLIPIRATLGFVIAIDDDEPPQSAGVSKTEEMECFDVWGMKQRPDSQSPSQPNQSASPHLPSAPLSDSLNTSLSPPTHFSPSPPERLSAGLIQHPVLTQLDKQYSAPPNVGRRQPPPPLLSQSQLIAVMDQQMIESATIAAQLAVQMNQNMENRMTLIQQKEHQTQDTDEDSPEPSQNNQNSDAWLGVECRSSWLNELWLTAFEHFDPLFSLCFFKVNSDPHTLGSLTSSLLPATNRYTPTNVTRLALAYTNGIAAILSGSTAVTSAVLLLPFLTTVMGGVSLASISLTLSISLVSALLSFCGISASNIIPSIAKRLGVPKTIVNVMSFPFDKLNPIKAKTIQSPVLLIRTLISSVITTVTSCVSAFTHMKNVRSPIVSKQLASIPVPVLNPNSSPLSSQIQNAQVAKVSEHDSQPNKIGPIVLIGLRCSGKHSIGTLLAQRMKRQEVDVVSNTEKRIGRSEDDIREAIGHTGFLGETETDLRKMMEMVEAGENIVAIVPSFINETEYGREMLQSLASRPQRTCVVYLRCEENTLLQRRKDRASQPDGKEDRLFSASNPKHTLHLLYARDDPLFHASSHIVVDTTHTTPQDATFFIWELLARFNTVVPPQS